MFDINFELLRYLIPSRARRCSHSSHFSWQFSSSCTISQGSHSIWSKELGLLPLDGRQRSSIAAWCSISSITCNFRIECYVDGLCEYVFLCTKLKWNEWVWNPNIICCCFPLSWQWWNWNIISKPVCYFWELTLCALSDYLNYDIIFDSTKAKLPFYWSQISHGISYVCLLLGLEGLGCNSGNLECSKMNSENAKAKYVDKPTFIWVTKKKLLNKKPLMNFKINK